VRRVKNAERGLSGLEKKKEFLEVRRGTAALKWVRSKGEKGWRAGRRLGIGSTEGRMWTRELRSSSEVRRKESDAASIP